MRDLVAVLNAVDLREELSMIKSCIGEIVRGLLIS